MSHSKENIYRSNGNTQSRISSVIPAEVKRRAGIHILHVLLFLSLIPINLNGISTADAATGQRRNKVVMAVESAGPSVVNISTTITEKVGARFPFSRNNFFRDIFPDLLPRQYTRTSLGSGVIIDGKKGLVVTNHHVVEKASEIKVITSDKKEYIAGILGTAPHSDLALLQIDPKDPLPEIRMGRSDDLMIGESVIAIGNPFGLSSTVTTGVISALERTVRAKDIVYRQFIQIDASINPGNSGGPLLNIEGDLIGINTAIYQKAEGIGFAIPIDKVKRIIKELIRAGEVRLPWLGLEIQDLDANLRTYFKLPDEGPGVIINEVVNNSPADESGLKRGDILLGIGKFSVESSAKYLEALAEFIPGEKLNLIILRDGKELKVNIDSSSFPEGFALELFEKRVGLQVREMSEKLKRQNNTRIGIYIHSVRPNSESARIGLEKGDIILKIHNVIINGLDDFKKAVSKNHHRESLTLIVARGGQAYSITLPF